MPLMLLALSFLSCAEGKAVPFNAAQAQVFADAGKGAAAIPASSGTDTALTLERIAELERAGSYFPGLGLIESALREKAGDYTGSAVAAYKELSWAYGYASLSMAQVNDGLQNAAVVSANLPVHNGSAVTALKGCMAFAAGNWKLAEDLLTGIVKADEEPDSFLRWMLLVCALENAADPAAARQAYSAIRARYTLFPEYWYRGARAFSGGDENIAASYAEQCINISPNGPFAGDCRKILAEHMGLAPDGRSIQNGVHAGIKTRAEIENIIRNSVSMNNPLILEELYPLMALPENPSTLYAMGALKSLSALPLFREFFIEGALKSQGRLAERLSYIARG